MKIYAKGSGDGFAYFEPVKPSQFNFYVGDNMVFECSAFTITEAKQKLADFYNGPEPTEVKTFDSV